MTDKGNSADFKNSIKKRFCINGHRRESWQEGLKKKRKEELVQAQKQSSQTFFVSEPEIKLLKWSILNNWQKLLQCLKAKYLLSRESHATHSQSCIFNHLV